MNPYPGLRPFRSEEQHVFMGRESAVSSLLTRLRLSPITLLIARSGVGKSSFLTCRVIPQLQETSCIRYRNEWGADRSDRLIAGELHRLLQEDTGKPEMPVVILDQFEDIFKLPDSTDALWDKFAELVNEHDGRFHLLISMREEWLGAWTESAEYLTPSVTTIFRLPPLTDKELASAILGPAAIEGSVQVDPQLADEILHDLKRPSAFGLGQAYVEPGLLQLVMSTMWAAAHQTERTIDVTLYNRMGRADRICRDFIWRELGRAGDSDSVFDKYDRVLWVGMTRHLVVAHGIKAIADPTSMARKLRLEDLGLAGPAVVHSRLPKSCAGYLRSVPERREAPPPQLIVWIQRVLDKGFNAGFLKRQHGLAGETPAPQERGSLRDIYEITHDFLGVLLQQFALEFETWVRGRYAMVVGVFFGLVMLASFSFTLAPLLLEGRFVEALLWIVGLAAALVVYLLLLYVLSIILRPVFRFVWYRILRLLIRGSVPYPSPTERKPSFVRRVLIDFARRFGFLPR